MGLWLVANCSPTLRVEHLPEEVRQDAQSIIRCYLPLNQNATLSSDHDKASDRETWWICPTVVAYQVRPGDLSTNFAIDSHSGLAYAWLTVEVPDNMDPFLSWSDILHYLPITVFMVAKQLKEWSHLDYKNKTTRHKRHRLATVTNGMDLVQQQLQTRSPAAVHPRLHSPSLSSSLLRVPSHTWHPLRPFAPVSATSAEILMGNTSLRYHERTCAENIITITPQRLSFRLQQGLGNPWASTATAAEDIVLLRLPNLHEYRLLYASLAALLEQCTSTESPQWNMLCQASKTFSCRYRCQPANNVRSWLGLTHTATMNG